MVKYQAGYVCNLKFLVNIKNFSCHEYILE